MKALIKEKLIETVRKYECLYNTKHNEYKNKNYKVLLWEEIGATLELEGNIAKETWRTLRDGYVRYKKQVKGKKGSGRKYCHYIWSSQLAFLDETLELRPKITSQVSPFPQQSSSPKPGPSHAETPESPPDASTTQLPLPIHTYYLPLSMPSSPERSIKIENVNISEERTGEVLEYLQNKNKESQDYDDVDHLFTSYAKTFKKLSPRNRAELKMSLAKIFAEAELRELNF